jgi:hypothetical protein
MGSWLVLGATEQGELSCSRRIRATARDLLQKGRRLGAGAIASLSGLGLLLIFMIQNAERVRFDFLFWKFTWRFGS